MFLFSYGTPCDLDKANALKKKLVRIIKDDTRNPQCRSGACNPTPALGPPAVAHAEDWESLHLTDGFSRREMGSRDS